MSRTTEVVVGIDIGTSSTKILLVDQAGEVVHTSRSESRAPTKNWREHDAEHDWWRVTCELLIRTLSEVDVLVVGVGLTGAGPNLLLTDAKGRCLGPALTYADDRATVQIERLEQELGADAIVQLCGHALNAESVGPKVLWLQENRPEHWADSVELHTSHTLVIRRLGGDYVIDHATASLWDPLYDPWKNQWIESMVDHFGLSGRMPRLAWSAEVVGQVSRSAAEQCGLPEGIPIIAGAVDFASEQLGVGATAPGQGTIVYGSTMVVQVMTDKVLAGRSTYSTVGPLPGTHLVGGVTGTAGTLLSWISKRLQVPDAEELLQLASESPAGARGLLMLPYFAGERSPLWDPAARGMILGLTLDHNDADIARAALEATALAMRHVLESLREGGVQINSARCTGGGADSTWAQIVTNCTGITQEAVRVKAAGAFGVAMLAWRAQGQEPVRVTPGGQGRTFIPENDAVATYDQLFPLYLAAYQNTAQIMHGLQRLSGV